MLALALDACVVTAAVLLPWAAIYLVARTRNRSLAAAAATVGVVLLILAEMLALSVLPMDRPLDLVPMVHGVVVAVSIGVLVRLRADARRELRRRATLIAAAMRPRAGRAWPVMWLAAAGLLTSLPYAAWNATDRADGLTYQLTVALQPVMDGRIARIEHWPIINYADAYPRTVQLVWGWSVLITRSPGAMGVTNWLALVALGVGTARVARLAGADRRASRVAACLVLTTPCFLYYAGTRYIDLPAAALVVTAAAAVMVRHRRRSWPADLVCIGAIGLVAASKHYLIIPAAVLAACYLWVLLRDARHERAPGRAALVIALGALVAAAAASQYLRSWVLYGSPVWPLEVRLGGTVLFDGPMSADALGFRTSGSVVERYATAFAPPLRALEVNANGVFGWAFAVVGLPAILALAARARRFGALVVLGVLMAGLLTPSGYAIRYIMYVVPMAMAAAALLVPATRRRRPRLAMLLALAALQAANLTVFVETLLHVVRPQIRSGAPIWGRWGNRPWIEQNPPRHGPPHDLEPEDYAAVYATVGRGELLVSCVWDSSGLLIDAGCTHRVTYRSLARHRARAGLPEGPEGGRAARLGWRAWLDEHAAATVIAFEHADEAKLLARDDDFREVYRRPAAEERWGVVIYRRSGGPTAAR